MDIIWLKADYLLPLDSGSKIRSYHIIKRVNQRHHVRWLGFCPLDTDNLSDSANKILTGFEGVHCEKRSQHDIPFYLQVAANLLSPYPFFVKRNKNGKIEKKIEEMVIAGQGAVIVCDSIDMALNIDFNLRVPKVLFHQSIETKLWQQRYESAPGFISRAYFNYETKRMASYETDICNQFDLVLVTSEDEKTELIERYHVKKPVEVIPTGVDCEYFKPREDINVVPKKLMFSGSMEMLSNIDQLLWFAAEIYPLIKYKHPDVTLDIVGRTPTSEMLALAQKDPSVRVTGWVEDIRQYLCQADIYIVPLRVPGGVRLKVYEAMACRRPVVSTSYGIDGLDLIPEHDLLVADNPRQFADAVCSLLDDKNKKDTIAEHGYRAVNTRCDWSITTKKFIEVLDSLITTHGR